MKATVRQSKLCSALWMIALVALAGCAETHWHVSPKPVSAELQIYTVDPKTGERKWMTHTREVYRYEEDKSDQRGPAQED